MPRIGNEVSSIEDIKKTIMHGQRHLKLKLEKNILLLTIQRHLNHGK